MRHLGGEEDDDRDGDGKQRLLGVLDRVACGGGPRRRKELAVDVDHPLHIHRVALRVHRLHGIVC